MIRFKITIKIYQKHPTIYQFSNLYKKATKMVLKLKNY